jgi:4-hydroxythreonine-4-phosphate dehydrogenase
MPNTMSNIRNKKLRIGITIGDVNGIGPELIIKTFDQPYFKELCIPILYGSPRVINIYRKILQMKFHYIVVQNPSQAQYKKLNIIDCLPDVERVDIGRPSEEGGRAAYEALQRAIADAQHGELDALVTMPIDKATFQPAAGSDFSGHTELLAKAFGVRENIMMMTSEDLKVALVTNHLPLRDVSRNLSPQRILTKIKLLHRSLHNDFNKPKGQIAVLGLNPHAGDNNLIGNEDEEIIKPAIANAKALGIRAEGPYPADGFFGSLTYRKFDAVLAMYHDQGLVPFKLLAGFRGVNFTAGMPMIRTSPDHGVAYDIAGTGHADPQSLQQALFLAIDVYYNRAENKELQANPLKDAKNKLIEEPAPVAPPKEAPPAKDKPAAPQEKPQPREESKDASQPKN